jgi:hypothetical protein
MVDNMMMPELRVMQIWLLALMMLPGRYLLAQSDACGCKLV